MAGQLLANLPSLVSSLAAVERQIIVDAYTRAGVPPVIDPATETAIVEKAQGYANAIHTWLTTYGTVSTTVSTSVSTTHASGAIVVTGTAVTQTNPAPVVGVGSGSGTGTGTIS